MDSGWSVLDQAGVGFCHARLSIIDLNESRARQPFLTDDGEVLMAHNGEFYDFQRIQRRSHRPGSSLQQQERFRDSVAALSASRLERDPALCYAGSSPSRYLIGRRGLSVSRAGSFRDQAPVLGDDAPRDWCSVRSSRCLFAHPAVERRFTSEGSVPSADADDGAWHHRVCRGSSGEAGACAEGAACPTVSSRCPSGRTGISNFPRKDERDSKPEAKRITWRPCAQRFVGSGGTAHGR